MLFRSRSAVQLSGNACPCSRRLHSEHGLTHSLRPQALSLQCGRRAGAHTGVVHVTSTVRDTRSAAREARLWLLGECLGAVNLELFHQLGEAKRGGSPPPRSGPGSEGPGGSPVGSTPAARLCPPHPRSWASASRSLFGHLGCWKRN